MVKNTMFSNEPTTSMSTGRVLEVYLASSAPLRCLLVRTRYKEADRKRKNRPYKIRVLPYANFN